MKPLFWLTNKGREHRLRWIAALLLSILFVVSAAEAGAEVERGEFPAVYQTTTRLNVRESDSAGSRRLGTLGKGEMVRVDHGQRMGDDPVQLPGGLHLCGLHHLLPAR